MAIHAEMLKRSILSTVAPLVRKAGYVLADPPRGSDLGKLTDYWIQGSLKNLLDPIRLHILVANLKALKDIPGDLAELGVWRGSSAKVLSELKGTRHLYLFDTFEGFNGKDLLGKDANQEALFSDTSLERVKSFIGTEGVDYVQGWFPASITDKARAAKYAFVHIDCDLGEPTKAALEFFYPRMSPGGIILIHDYGTGTWPALTEAVDSFFSDKPERPVLLPDACCSAIIRTLQRPKGGKNPSVGP